MQIVVAGPEHLPIIQTLFREYEQELDADLCFQSFEAELADPFKKYGEPKGALFLAFDGTAAAGCIALQPLSEAGICEMKRLYVRPAYRKTGLGRLLVTQLLETARIKQYHTMRLDTLEKLQPAIKLYASFGFREVGAYYDNPLEGVVYMEKGLGVSR